MPYNLAMNQLTLALPFALPPPELAPDLIRAMQTPALAALLSRYTKYQHFTFDSTFRVLPHEAWLAHAAGQTCAPGLGQADASVASAVMRGYGLAQSEGYWLLLQPVHIQISRNHLLMSDPRQLELSDAHARALFDSAKPYFDEIGLTLLYGDAGTWFLRADDWTSLQTATPDAAIGLNLSDAMPLGESARACRKLQNEVQMLWYEHPANAERLARGQAEVNSIWIWGGAPATASAAAGSAAGTGNVGGGPLSIGAAPPWMAALAEPARRAPDVRQAIADGGTVLLGELIPNGLAGDWGAWLAQMQALEQHWFAPLLAALKDGSLGRLTLTLSHRNGWHEVSCTKNALRAFWRKHNLNKLLT
ncbi:hypothetical protein HSX11_13335 [Oxalobacteraceae bacterium]|nr:hypothetical protein [Oxalobacteraceae bacterium]